jgi:hypothetical protein
MISLNGGRADAAALLNKHPIFRNLYVGSLDDTNNRYFYDGSGVLRSFPVLPENPSQEQIDEYNETVLNLKAVSRSGAPVAQHINSRGRSVDSKISQIILDEDKFLNVIANGSINKSDRIYYENFECSKEALEAATICFSKAVAKGKVKNSFGFSKKELANGGVRIDLGKIADKYAREAIENNDEIQFRDAMVSKMRAQGLGENEIKEIQLQ